MLHDGKPQAGTAVPGVARFAPVEPLKDVGHVLGRYPFAAVGYRQAGPTGLSLCPDGNRSTGRRVPERIVEKVGENLSQAHFIAEDLYRLQPCGAKVPAICPLPGLVQHFRHQMPKSDWALLDHLARFGPCQDEQVGHEPAHARDLLARLLKAFRSLLFARDAVEEIEVGAKGQKWVPQLM